MLPGKSRGERARSERKRRARDSEDCAPARGQPSPGDPVVVRLSHSPDRGDVGFHQVVLGQV